MSKETEIARAAAERDKAWDAADVAYGDARAEADDIYFTAVAEITAREGESGTEN